ncbi:hypothetical protein SprV_0401723600 [Sparganum proliferum]
MWDNELNLSTTSQSQSEHSESSATLPLVASPKFKDVFNRWNADHGSDRHELEKKFRLMFRRAYDRLQKRTSKLSTSRPLDDTADDNENTPRPGPSGPSSQP